MIVKYIVTLALTLPGHVDLEPGDRIGSGCRVTDAEKITRVLPSFPPQYQMSTNVDLRCKVNPRRVKVVRR